MTEGQNSIASDQLRALIGRIENLEVVKVAAGEDIKEVYGEAKANGFNTKIIRKIVALRKKSHAMRQEEEALMELYLEALGEQLDLPLGQEKAA